MHIAADTAFFNSLVFSGRHIHGSKKRDKEQRHADKHKYRFHNGGKQKPAEKIQHRQQHGRNQHSPYGRTLDVTPVPIVEMYSRHVHLKKAIAI